VSKTKIFASPARSYHHPDRLNLTDADFKEHLAVLLSKINFRNGGAAARKLVGSLNPPVASRGGSSVSRVMAFQKFILEITLEQKLIFRV